MDSAGPRTRLLNVVIGQDAEDDRPVRRHAGLQDALRCCLADEVEVFGFSPDYTADGNDGIATGVFQKPLPREGQFETAWNVMDADIG